MLKISEFYLDKRKSFIPKINTKCTMYIALFSANRWRLDVLTFLIKGFVAIIGKKYFSFSYSLVGGNI